VRVVAGLENSLGQPKIGDAHAAQVALVGKQQVLQLQVAVRDALGVQVGDALEDGAEDSARVALAVGAALQQRLQQLAAAQQLCDDKAAPA
jgi:hypothetical protein